MISSSRKIVILVLPFSVTTGPLFPLEKSYSFLISTHLSEFRFANGDDSLIVSTMGIYDNSHTPESICDNRDEPLFAYSGSILNFNAIGSFRTPSPSVRETPCFRTFAASFFGSKVMPISQYMHLVHISQMCSKPGTRA